MKNFGRCEILGIIFQDGEYLICHLRGFGRKGRRPSAATPLFFRKWKAAPPAQIKSEQDLHPHIRRKITVCLIIFDSKSDWGRVPGTWEKSLIFSVIILA